MTYLLDMCSWYTNPIKDVYVFDTHNKAFPVWGTYANRFGKAFKLVTFDSHADTRTAGALFICKYAEEDDEIRKDNPEWQMFLKRFDLEKENYSFEDAFRLANELGNDEQIKMAYDAGYVDDIQIFTRCEECIMGNYEYQDRYEEYDISYHFVDKYETDFQMLERVCVEEQPIILDVDLDFFVVPFDFESELVNYLKKLIRKATLITIATEPEYFQTCRRDGFEGFSNEQALNNLLDVIVECREIE